MGEDGEKVDQLGDYMTLAHAAESMGYRGGYGNFRRAAAQGKLRTVFIGKTRLTTRPWLDAYLATLRPGNYKRGLPKGQDAGGEAEEKAP